MTLDEFLHRVHLFSAVRGDPDSFRAECRIEYRRLMGRVSREREAAQLNVGQQILGGFAESSRLQSGSSRSFPRSKFVLPDAKSMPSTPSTNTFASRSWVKSSTPLTAPGWSNRLLPWPSAASSSVIVLWTMSVNRYWPIPSEPLAMTGPSPAARIFLAASINSSVVVGISTPASLKDFRVVPDRPGISLQGKSLNFSIRLGVIFQGRLP